MQDENKLSIHYQKFFDKFNQIETLQVNEWKVVHLLSYLCKRYESYYGLKFTFSLKGSPSKSREVYEITKLGHQLSTDPIILKHYIDWVFDTKIIERKKRITSLGYFTHTDIVNEYKFKFLFNKKIIGRTDLLPIKVKEICHNNGHTISTYGELSFLKKIPNQDKMFQDLTSIGFDVNGLDKIV